MIGEAAGEYSSKIGFPENEASILRRWLHDFEPVSYLENLGDIDHCACFLRTQSQRTNVEGQILPIPPTQLTHAAVSCFATFAGRRSLRAPCHTQPRAEATKDIFKWLVSAYLSLSEAKNRNRIHCLEPPPNGQEQEEVETISDHPRHPAC